MEKQNNGRPKFDVWVMGLPGEDGMQVGAEIDVKLMRRAREQNADTLVFPEAATLKITSVKPRRRQGSESSTHRELEVEVVFTKNVQHGKTNQFDDGRGLEAFRADTECTVVYWPSDQMARVSRHSAVLR